MSQNIMQSSSYNIQSNARLQVNLDAIADNYKLLKSRHKTGNCAAVVKADAYGLGVERVAKRLQREECKIFFVATLSEAIKLRSILKDEIIYVFHGVFAGEEEIFIKQNLRPVLNSLEHVKRWKEVASSNSHAFAALHVDTGMCRLGLTPYEMQQIDDGAKIIRECNINLMMSHLASAGEPDSPLNSKQLAAFKEAKEIFAGVDYSLINSSGHFLDEEYHFDIGRPGCSLYGITPNDDKTNPMRHVATLKAPIIQIRQINRDQTIGYGATARVRAGMKVAVVAFGYADGLHRIASNRLSGFIGGHEVRMLGRVSMDMSCYDVTKIDNSLLESHKNIALIDGENQTVDKVAEICHTIGYEIFTSLSSRVSREYV